LPTLPTTVTTSPAPSVSPDIAAQQPPPGTFALPPQTLVSTSLSARLPGSELLSSTPMTIPPITVAPSASLATGELAHPITRAPSYSWYRVSYLGGISLRCAPSIDAPLTGVVLPQNETFAVCAEVLSADRRIFLQLLDGRGWAFDDSALIPHDPSVKRGLWLSTDTATEIMSCPPGVFGDVEVGASSCVIL
jgi:hypothetical protein